MAEESTTRKPLRPSQPLGIRAGLERYQSPLDRRRAAHLLRRTSFLGSSVDVSDLVGRSAEEVVDEMILAAQIAPQPIDPYWVDNVPPPREAPSAVRRQYNRDNKPGSKTIASPGSRNSWTSVFGRT